MCVGEGKVDLCCKGRWGRGERSCFIIVVDGEGVRVGRCVVR